jgi:hypothetical protein
LNTNYNKAFNRSELNIKPLSERVHDLDMSSVRSLRNDVSTLDQEWKKIAQQIVRAKKNGSSIVLMIGAHVLRAGTQRYIIDLMERGYLSCIAMNGAGVIHDYEYSLIGSTTESVAKYVVDGQFGLWKETGEINDIINEGYKKGMGLGEAVGQAISEGDFPHKDISLLAAGHKLKIPVTVHVSIGCDIIHEHPNCDGAATGATSYSDFLYFAKIIENLEGGVVMNFGSAVMAPEVYLKALSMARNVAHQKGRSIKSFSAVVCDLHDLPKDFQASTPPKNSAAYYFRPWKTMLVRTVVDGGQSFYIKGDHSTTVPTLWAAINDMDKF